MERGGAADGFTTTNLRRILDQVKSVSVKLSPVIAAIIGTDVQSEPSEKLSNTLLFLLECLLECIQWILSTPPARPFFCKPGSSSACF